MNESRRSTILHPDGRIIELFGGLADRYEKEIANYYASNCEHNKVEIRQKEIRGGAIQCRPQCVSCGASVGNAVKKNKSAPSWSSELHEEYLEQRKRKLESIYLKYIKISIEEKEKLESKSKDWQDKYKAYRRTPEWQNKRSRVISRANGICEGCLNVPATVVHHLEYSQMGDELFFQLVALCSACHQKVHPEHHEPAFYDNDYIPCFQCRWGGEGIDCYKFDKRTYEVLSSDGECGPTAKEFEGLK